MGCSTCGGAKNAARTPGGTAKYPIVFGDADGRPPQTATFLAAGNGAGVGEYRYVSGDGVENAVEDGLIALGFIPSPSAVPAKEEKPTPVPSWYVRIGNNRWIGFKTRTAADRYARIRGGVVASRDEVIGGT